MNDRSGILNIIFLMGYIMKQTVQLQSTSDELLILQMPQCLQLMCTIEGRTCCVFGVERTDTTRKLNMNIYQTL